MRAALFFRTIDGDAVPYLWNDATGQNHKEDESQRLTSESDFEIARHSGASNRSRTIVIVEGRQAAISVALMAQEDYDGRSIITHIGNDAWAVGTLRRNGEYDSGIPTVTDARAYGERVEISVDDAFSEQLMFTQLATAFRADFEEIQPQPQPELEPEFG